MEKHHCFKCGKKLGFDEVVDCSYYSTGMCADCQTGALAESYEEEAVLDGLVAAHKYADKMSGKGVVVAIQSYGVHLMPEAFKQFFGVGDDIKKEMRSAYVRCSKMYKGTEFFALFTIDLDIEDVLNKSLKEDN